MSNLSKKKRERMLQFLEELKAKNSDEEDIRAINEIEMALTEKKYGLVWEEHMEQVDDKLKQFIPVFTQDRKKCISTTSSEISNFLLQGDNLHSLYLLEKTHKRKIDVIYIDPPYNTGNNDFIYNDHYIEKNDEFIHSKWLSFMSKRLHIARELLSDAGVLVISIGSQEVANLHLLCNEIFPDKVITTVTVQTSGGKPSNGFTVLNEYLIYVTPNEFKPRAMNFVGGISRSPFEGLTLSTYTKVNRPNQVYPIFIDRHSNSIIGVGKSLADRIKDKEYIGEKSNFEYDYTEGPASCECVWPVSSKGLECVWRLIPERLMADWKKGYIKVSKNKSKANQNKYSIQYLPKGVIEKIESGKLLVEGKESNGHTLILGNNQTSGSEIPTIWSEKSFHTTKGSSLIRHILGNDSFSYPKSLEYITEVLRGITNSNSIILDFFAGSGTTGQSVLELNQMDGGNRRFILCTNNENNICDNVTYPRLKTVITGKRNDGSYYSEGLPANLLYYKTDFIPRYPEIESVRDLTLQHTAEMIQLENMQALDRLHIAILDESEIEEIIRKASAKATVYIASDVFISNAQLNSLEDKGCDVVMVPDHYFEFELKEVGE